MEDILKVESNRNKDNIRTIYFYKEGNSPWYRAYELSAYYAVHYNNSLKEKERLQASRKSNKIINEGIMQIGLQLESFKKYFPEAELQEIKENTFSIVIPSSDLCDITLVNYKEKLVDWKNTFDIKSKNKKQSVKEVNKTVYSSPVSFTSIMKEIIRYDTHNRTEDEFRCFLNTLKEMCADLI